MPSCPADLFVFPHLRTAHSLSHRTAPDCRVPMTHREITIVTRLKRVASMPVTTIAKALGRTATSLPRAFVEGVIGDMARRCKRLYEAKWQPLRGGRLALALRGSEDGLRHRASVAASAEQYPSVARTLAVAVSVARKRWKHGLVAWHRVFNGSVTIASQ